MTKTRHDTPEVAPAGSAGKVFTILALAALAFFASYAYASAGDVDGGTAAASAAYVEGDSDCACCNEADAVPVEGFARADGGIQRIFVDASSGFAPNVVRASAGVPLEIAFGEGQGCMSEVVFPGFDVVEDLTRGGAVVTLPALAPGEYGFSCGMEMVFGVVVAE